VVTLRDGDPGVQIFSADGTRTSVLVTSVLHKSVSFHCDASFSRITHFNERKFDVSVLSKFLLYSITFPKHWALPY